MLYTSICQLVGNTPLLCAASYCRACGTVGNINTKLECFNPAGSAKDRVAIAMLEEARQSGVLSDGGTIIEPTSGNTGIGLAAYGISMGYRVILTMPDTMSAERRTLLHAYGAELVLTNGALGMAGAIKKAQELHEKIPGSIIAGQFENPANPRAHYETTGPELWRDTKGEFSAFVAGVGTGGTLSGTGRYFKQRNVHIRIVAVEPAASPLLSGGKAGAHGLQGIGANFIPENYDASVVDEICRVTEQDAYASARLFAKTQGILVGITSGATLYAATLLAKREEFAGKHIVALLPDSGERYLSTPLFQEV